MPTNNFQQYRDNLAAKIKNAPKHERRGILEEAKKQPEYWEARAEKNRERKNFFTKNWIKILAVIIAVVAVSFLVKLMVPAAEAPSNPSPVQMANPASVNCVDKGGKLSIINEAEGQIGMCTLPGGTVCEEWAFFRGECPKE